MEGAGPFNSDPFFFPHLSGASLGPCDWRHLWTLYKKVVKNLLPFFLMHALADMFGSSLMYLLINWGS